VQLGRLLWAAGDQGKVGQCRSGGAWTGLQIQERKGTHIKCYCLLCPVYRAAVIPA
jgi:hypothetical protein